MKKVNDMTAQEYYRIKKFLVAGCKRRDVARFFSRHYTTIRLIDMADDWLEYLAAQRSKVQKARARNPLPVMMNP